tara:strand:+ start:1539 stop:1724 length:186 start_codon:yes stop_codon:yes gene_type:complete
MEDEQKPAADKMFEKEQVEELRARYEIMLKYFHDMTAKLQELKQENDDLKKKLMKASEKTT